MIFPRITRALTGCRLQIVNANGCQDRVVWLSFPRVRDDRSRSSRIELIRDDRHRPANVKNASLNAYLLKSVRTGAIYAGNRSWRRHATSAGLIR